MRYPDYGPVRSFGRYLREVSWVGWGCFWVPWNHIGTTKSDPYILIRSAEDTPAGVRSSSVIQEVGPCHEPPEDVRVSPADRLLNSEPGQPFERLVRANHLGDERHTVDGIRMA